MSELILITGATGALGPVFVEEFVRAGYRVRAQGRVARPDLFPPAVEAVGLDVTDAHQLDRAAEGVDVIVHLAALLHVSNPSPELDAEYRRVNVESTRNLTLAAIRHGVRRFVYVSTIAVYGYNREELLDERSVPAPSTAYGLTKLEAENVVLAARLQTGEPLGVVLRLAAVYGARVKGNYRTLLRSIALRRFVPIGRGSNRRTLVHERDAARAAVLAAKHPGAVGQVFNVSDGQLHTVESIVAAIYTALGRKRPRISVPLFAAMSAAQVIEFIARVAGRRPPAVRAAIQKYIEEVTVSSQAIREELDFDAAFDLQGGWRDVVQRMRASGDL